MFGIHRRGINFKEPAMLIEYWHGSLPAASSSLQHMHHARPCEPVLPEPRASRPLPSVPSRLHVVSKLLPWCCVAFCAMHGGLTGLVGLGQLLQLANKLVKVFLSLLPVCQGLLLEVRAVSLRQVREGCYAHGEDQVP
jgi:hypothetical protein